MQYIVFKVKLGHTRNLGVQNERCREKYKKKMQLIFKTYIKIKYIHIQIKKNASYPHSYEFTYICIKAFVGPEKAKRQFK